MEMQDCQSRKAKKGYNSKPHPTPFKVYMTIVNE